MLYGQVWACRGGAAMAAPARERARVTIEAFIVIDLMIVESRLM
jgi:hypothetical protein